MAEMGCLRGACFENFECHQATPFFINGNLVTGNAHLGDVETANTNATLEDAHTYTTTYDGSGALTLTLPDGGHGTFTKVKFLNSCDGGVNALKFLCPTGKKFHVGQHVQSTAGNSGAIVSSGAGHNEYRYVPAAAKTNFLGGGSILSFVLTKHPVTKVLGYMVELMPEADKDADPDTANTGVSSFA